MKSPAEIARPPKPPLRIALFWCDPHRLFSFGWKPIGQEVERTFAKTGVELDWRRGPLEHTREADGSLQVQVLLVRSEPMQWGLPSDAMGAVLSRDGTQRNVYVFFPAVARSLGYESLASMARWPSSAESRNLAIALGRVVTHEVVHALAPSAAHADAGLARAHLNRELLLRPVLELDPATAQAFRAALGVTKMLAPLPTVSNVTR